MTPKIVLSRLVTATLFLVAVLLLIWRFYPLAQTSAGPHSLTLKAPPFVSMAKAADAAVVSTISDEAGISAYFQSSSPVDLNTVRSTFRTIESETSDYIIGSVPLPGYDETQDIHAYIHTSGWVLVYYLKADPVSKIFDWKGYESSGPTVIPTKLEAALTVIATQIGTSSAGATFYDFRYPNANQLRLIAKQNGSFQVKLPSTYTYFERSWSATTRLTLDSKFIGSDGYDTLTPAQLIPDQFHTLFFPNYDGGLALIYRVP